MARLTVLFAALCWLLDGPALALEFRNAEEILEYVENNVNVAVESWRTRIPQDLGSPEDRLVIQKRAESHLLNAVNELSFKLDDIERTLDHRSEAVGKVVQRLPNRTKLFIQLETLWTYLFSIDQAYNELLRYVRKLVDNDEHELIAFAEKIVSPSSHSIQRNMYSIFSEFCRDIQSCVLYSLFDEMKVRGSAGGISMLGFGGIYLNV